MAATFADELKKIPFSAKTKEGQGFLPPFIRAMNHLLTISQFVQDSKKKDKAPFVVEELTHANHHLVKLNVGSFLSSKVKDSLVAFGKLMLVAQTEASTWTDEQVVENCWALMDRGTMICSMLDRELIGLGDSDPGSQL